MTDNTGIPKPQLRLNLNGTVNAAVTESVNVGAYTTLSVNAHLEETSGTWGTAVVTMQTSDNNRDWTNSTTTFTAADLYRGIDISTTWYVRFKLTTVEGAAGYALLDPRLFALGDVGTLDDRITRCERRTHTIYIQNPLAADVFMIGFPQNAIQVVEAHATTDVGTVDFNIEHRAKTTPDVAGTDILTADLQATAASATTTTFDNSGNVAADKWLTYVASAVAAAPTELWVAVEYLIKAD